MVRALVYQTDCTVFKSHPQWNRKVIQMNPLPKSALLSLIFRCDGTRSKISYYQGRVPFLAVSCWTGANYVIYFRERIGRYMNPWNYYSYSSVYSLCYVFTLYVTLDITSYLCMLRISILSDSTYLLPRVRIMKSSQKAGIVPCEV